ncbi:molybdopterin-dependent oxidoreductase [Leptolyngbya sp. 15MV]|nr:molybdopterin-dependent oxidoreductase [Leptolyngbya sp. 15MV]
MREVDFRRVDLNLLVALEALLEERSVTRAAQRLGMSQPAMSRALGRLRALFSDTLLVDGPGGYILSARAEHVRPGLRRILAGVGDLLTANAFDPATATGRIRLLMPDLQAATLAPHVLALFAREAPSLDLDIVPPGTNPIEALENGVADAIVGLIDDAPAGIQRRRLYDEKLVTLMRVGHPALTRKLTLERYLALEHIVVSVTGVGPPPVDEVLARMGTAFRGFGGPQGALLIEDVVHRVAAATGLPPEAVRARNFAGVGGNSDEVPYGQRLEGDLIARVWAEAKQGSEWDRRRDAIAAFNASHPSLRRGLGSMVLAFGISFGIQHLNQAGALVHVYSDGSIRLNHGGTEMGQGLFIKVAQVVCDVFGVDLDRVAITATSTAEVPNTAPTAASTGSDLNGWAAHHAARAIRDRMAEVAARRWGIAPEAVIFADNKAWAERIGANRAFAFSELARLCFLERVSLSATGFYKTPDIHWDPKAMRGHPFFYFSYGAAVAEVIVDTLTGEHRCLRADLVQDCGRSLNPAVDRGQIEGAFVQGLGWLTCEELWWDAAGRLRTVGPSTYKIPGSRDVPVMNLRLLDGAPARVDTIFRSKAVGEPPLLLAISVWNALKDAIGTPALDLPATPERVLMAWRAKQGILS